MKQVMEQMVNKCMNYIQGKLHILHTRDNLLNLILDLQNGKVDKVKGKGLSHESFTTEYKNYLDTIKSIISIKRR